MLRCPSEAAVEEKFDEFNLEEVVEYDAVREKIESIIEEYELTELINLLKYLESDNSSGFDTTQLLS